MGDDADHGVPGRVVVGRGGRLAGTDREVPAGVADEGVLGVDPGYGPEGVPAAVLGEEPARLADVLAGQHEVDAVGVGHLRPGDPARRPRR